MRIRRRGYRRADGTLVRPTAYETPRNPAAEPPGMISPLAALRMVAGNMSKDRQGRLEAVEALFGIPREKRMAAEEKRIQQAPAPEPEEVKPKLMRRAFDFE